MRRIKTALGIALIVSQPAFAQDRPVTKSAPPLKALEALAGSTTDVLIERTGRTNAMRVRLLDVDDSRLLVEVKQRTSDGTELVKVEVPLAEVRRVRTIKRDRPLEGAIFGALYMTACGLWWCQQGLDGESPSGLSLMVGAGFGAAVFGAIDYAIPSKRTVYTAATPTQQARLTFAWSYRW